MPRATFVSDVHLHPGEPERTRQFLSFLESERSRGTPNLFILGDLFHVWAGPKHASLPDYRRVLDALAALGSAGTRITFFHGNRDFHVDGRFRDDLHVRVVRDFLEVGIAPRRTIYLAHGDLLCARDHRYRRMRGIIRSDPAVRLYRAMPLWMSLGIAGAFRLLSEREVARKKPRELSLSMREVEGILGRGPLAMVVGHVHHATITELSVAGERKILVTLGAWEGEVSFARLEGGRLDLHNGRAGEHVQSVLLIGE